MEMISITTEELKKLVETAIQFGIDSPELNKKTREKIANWMVENTIKDIKAQRQKNIVRWRNWQTQRQVSKWGNINRGPGI